MWAHSELYRHYRLKTSNLYPEMLFDLHQGMSPVHRRTLRVIQTGESIHLQLAHSL